MPASPDPIPIPVPTGALGVPSPTPVPAPAPAIDWSGAEGAFTHWVQSAGQWFMPQLQDALGNGGTTPGADWFVNPIYETMLGLGLAFAVPLTIVGLIASLRSGSFAILGHMVMNLFLAIAISQAAIWVVVLLDNLADDITNWSLGKLAGSNVDGLVTHLAVVFGAAAAGTAFSGAPELIGVILGGAIVLGRGHPACRAADAHGRHLPGTGLRPACGRWTGQPPHPRVDAPPGSDRDRSDHAQARDRDPPRDRGRDADREPDIDRPAGRPPACSPSPAAWS